MFVILCDFKYNRDVSTNCDGNFKYENSGTPYRPVEFVLFSSDRRTTGLPDYRTTGLPDYRPAELPDCRTALQPGELNEATCCAHALITRLTKLFLSLRLASVSSSERQELLL